MKKEQEEKQFLGGLLIGIIIGAMIGYFTFRIVSVVANTPTQEAHKRDFINGARYQSERMYSEQEVFELTLKALDLGMTIRQDQLNGYSEKSGKDSHKEWFEQFKKK